jgi:hypothetical protein
MTRPIQKGGEGGAGSLRPGPWPRRAPSIYFKNNKYVRIPFNWIVFSLFWAFRRCSFDIKSDFVSIFKYIHIFICITEWGGGPTFMIGRDFISPFSGPGYDELWSQYNLGSMEWLIFKYHRPDNFKFKYVNVFGPYAFNSYSCASYVQARYLYRYTEKKIYLQVSQK